MTFPIELDIGLSAGRMDMADEAYVPVLDHVARHERGGVAPGGRPRLPRLYGWLRERAIVPAGPPLIRFRTFDPAGKPTRIDVGVPIADAIDGGDGIEAAILPARARCRDPTRPCTRAHRPLA